MDKAQFGIDPAKIVTCPEILLSYLYKDYVRAQLLK